MGTFALTDCRVEVNGVVMSQWVTSVQLPQEFEALEDTAFGDSARSRIAGLEDSTVTINFNDDFAAAAVDATLWAARKTVVVVKVRPTTAAISATNPEYVGSFLVNQINPFGNSVGQLATRSVAWPLSDPDGIARNTT
ncbi:MAG TPA: hypothetical protein VIQ30_25625 [Pseudonocardia sp.]